MSITKNIKECPVCWNLIDVFCGVCPSCGADQEERSIPMRLKHQTDLSEYEHWDVGTYETGYGQEVYGN